MTLKSQAQQDGVWNDPAVQQRISQQATAAAFGTAYEARALTKPDEVWDRLQDPKVKAQLGGNYDKVFTNVRESLSRAYVSKTEEIEATNPSAAPAFVEANKDKFGDRYGAMLKQVSESSLNAQASKNYDTLPTPGAPASPGATVGGLPPNDPGLRPGYSYEGAAFGHESGGKAGVINSTPYTDTRGVYHPQGTGAGGLGQIIPSTADAIRKAHPELGLQPGWQTDSSPEGVAKQRAGYAAFTQDNRAALTRVGIEPTDKNTFMAAFLGAGGATSFIKAAQANPNQVGASLFPEEAAANRSVFFSGQGANAVPRTLGQIYALMTSRFSGRPTVGPGNFTVGGDRAIGGPDEGEEAPRTAPEAPTLATLSAIDPTKPLDASAPPAPPEVSEEARITMEAQKTYQDKLAGIENSDFDDEMKNRMGQVAQRRYERAMAQAGLAQQQREARERAVSDDVLSIAGKGDYPGAYARLEQYVNAHQIDYKYYDTMSTVLAQQSGDPNPKWMGPGYHNAVQRTLLDKKDPNYLGSVRQLDELQASGQITSRGRLDLKKQIDELHESEDEVGLQTVRAEGLKALEQKLGGGEDPLGKIRNPKGIEIFRTLGVAQYNRAFNEWRAAVKEGNGDDFFALSDPKKLDAFAESLYPRSERDLDAIREGGAPAPEAPGTPLPPVPDGLSAAGWASYMQRVPTLQGQPLPHQAWGNLLSILASDHSPETMAAWDRRFGAAGPDFKAVEVLRSLTPTQQAPQAETPAPVTGQTLVDEENARAAERAAERLRNFGAAIRSIPEIGAPHYPMTPEEERFRLGVAPQPESK